jgi:hypothetical protein
MGVGRSRGVCGVKGRVLPGGCGRAANGGFSRPWATQPWVRAARVACPLSGMHLGEPARPPCMLGTARRFLCSAADRQKAVPSPKAGDGATDARSPPKRPRNNIHPAGRKGKSQLDGETAVWPIRHRLLSHSASRGIQSSRPRARLDPRAESMYSIERSFVFCGEGAIPERRGLPCIPCETRQEVPLQ